MSVSFEEYFRSTLEDKLVVKMPEREEDHLTPGDVLIMLSLTILHQVTC